MQHETSRIALVTGANRGIGFETARQLSRRGVHVLLGGRSPVRVDAAVRDLREQGCSVSELLLDVMDPDSIGRAVEQIEARHGHLDVLVNNAAVRVEKYGISPSDQPLSQWRETFETNLFAVVSVTQALLPLIRRSDAGRIVNVSSLLGSVTTHTDPDSYAFSDTFKSLPAYSASKSAINSWTVHLAYELRATTIKVNAVHPGYTRTGMNDGAGEQSAADGAATSVAMSTLPADGPTGTYRHLDEVVPW
jgi:NAD(P)-dependent dehydrogenase (short-subunit alcohol dehydrogenase family)